MIKVKIRIQHGSLEFTADSARLEDNIATLKNATHHHSIHYTSDNDLPYSFNESTRTATIENTVSIQITT